MRLNGSCFTDARVPCLQNSAPCHTTRSWCTALYGSIFVAWSRPPASSSCRGAADPAAASEVLSVLCVPRSAGGCCCGARPCACSHACSGLSEPHLCSCWLTSVAGLPPEGSVKVQTAWLPLTSRTACVAMPRGPHVLYGPPLHARLARAAQQVVLRYQAAPWRLWRREAMLMQVFARQVHWPDGLLQSLPPMLAPLGAALVQSAAARCLAPGLLPAPGPPPRIRRPAVRSGAPHLRHCLRAGGCRCM